MISLNDNNIFVGEIKQLLKTFNLPNCLVGDYRGKPYINHIYLYRGNLYCNYYENDSSDITTKLLSSYIYGDKYLNVTSNLKLNNLLYDRSTHRYLGKYLRFIRDYNNINLMSMYNLFDGEVYYNDVELKDSHSSITLKNGDGYIIYSVPVHFGYEYTIKTNSKFKIECGVILNSYKNDSLNNKKYYKKSNDKMFVYKNLLDCDYSDLDNDTNLRLVIRVPESTSNITVLEGNYIESYNGILFECTGLELESSDSFSLETSDGLLEEFYTKPSLLTYINNNFLLSDKIMEYITGNAITNLSNQYDIHKLDVLMMKNNIISSKYAGVWTDNDKTAIEDYILNNIYSNNEKHRCSNYDMLGYCDSDVEKSMTKYSGGLV